MNSEIGIGTRIPKENFDALFYAECAAWCAANQATIRDKGAYYEVVEAPPPPPSEISRVFSKLKVRRAMRSLGIESRLDAILGSSPTFAADWLDAQEIDLDDPVLREALAAGNISDEEIASIENVIRKGA